LLTLVLVATLWKKLPDLKLAIPFEEVKYSPPTKDVGIIELPVVF
jgi:nitric oxide reductase